MNTRAGDEGYHPYIIARVFGVAIGLSISHSVNKHKFLQILIMSMCRKKNWLYKLYKKIKSFPKFTYGHV